MFYENRSQTVFMKPYAYSQMLRQHRKAEKVARQESRDGDGEVKQVEGPGVEAL